MPDSSIPEIRNAVSLTRKALGYGAHIYTSTGAVWAFLTGLAIVQGNHALAFLWMTIAVFVDSTDGTLARWARVQQTAPGIDGGRMDDIVDYLNYTFMPVLLIWHAGWLPEPAWLWTMFPLIASLVAFSNVGAKEDDEGFFVGFPSYWNVFAFYTALCFRQAGAYVVLGAVLVLSVLSVVRLRFVYPSKAPRWKWLFVIGAVVWMVICLAMLPLYPNVPNWLVLLSMVYPFAYVVLSIYLDLTSRRTPKTRIV
jgi:phosphatidylcholine synthase